MIRRRSIPQTTLSVSPIIYGCMQIGGSWTDDPLRRADIDRALSCIKAAIDGGVNFFDHADIYTRGKSEEAFSYSWSELGVRREDVVLQSKCGIRRAGDPDSQAPHRYDLSGDYIRRSVESSLRRLKCDRLDLLLLHRPDPLIDPDEVGRIFESLRTEGLVRYFGVSNHNGDQIALLQRSVPFPLAVNQLEFNLIHSDLVDEGVSVNNASQRLTVRGDGTLDYCRLHDICVQAYSPLAKGTISSPPSDADARTIAVAEVVRQVGAARGISPEAVQVAWILQHPAKIMPVLGTTRPDRIVASLQGLSVDLTREEWYRLFTAGRGRALP